ncbi:MAG: hypothetical protein FD152_4210 [Xanthobacteraceae bacterium]|nr:MAG: hypothetical protein FD152_4210 [Xanthobacteraceae bacterium]
MYGNRAVFHIGEVAAAAQVAPSTIRNWIQRGLILLGDDEKPADAGLPRVFSFGTAKTIAVVAALVRLGIPPSEASPAALAWLEVDRPGCEAGALYSEGHTLLSYFGGGKAEVMQFGTAAALMPWVASDGAAQSSVAVVHLNALDAQLRNGLPRKE